ncbi:MAG: apolipoprotein A1/A4/E family protein [Acidobacteria bacterium]|nr:apolipoprotein A1/A4/E family protein [Acidobacteriota bacterium]
MKGQQVLVAQRRSSRVPVTVPVLVTTLNPGSHFSEICETLVVNAHGCAFRSPFRLDKGVPLHLHSEEGRQTNAQVVSCRPLGANQQGWMLAASLDQPQNFWGLKSFPQDWGPQASAAPPKLGSNNTNSDRLTQEVVYLKEQLKTIQRQVSEQKAEDRIAGLLNPLQGELAELKKKLSDARRSRFEVSLSHIPPELQEQLWIRLRKELGAQALRQTLEQSEQVLGAAREAIDQKVAEGQERFAQRLSEDLSAAEERMRGLLSDSAARVRQHIGAGLEEFQQRAAQAAGTLEHKGEQLVESLARRLSEEHETYRRQMQKLQSALAEESTRLEAQLSALRDRVNRLDQAARHLEVDFERRLSETATEIASAAHGELEDAVKKLVTEAETRNAKELSDQLDQACDHLKIIQKGVEASVSDTLKRRAADQLTRFEQTTEELVQQSGDEWRERLAKGLNAVVDMLGQQFCADRAAEETRT